MPELARGTQNLEEAPLFRHTDRRSHTADKTVPSRRLYADSSYTAAQLLQGADGNAVHAVLVCTPSYFTVRVKAVWSAVRVQYLIDTVRSICTVHI